MATKFVSSQNIIISARLTMQTEFLNNIYTSMKQLLFNVPVNYLALTITQKYISLLFPGFKICLFVCLFFFLIKSLHNQSELNLQFNLTWSLEARAAPRPVQTNAGNSYKYMRNCHAQFPKKQQPNMLLSA